MKTASLDFQNSERKRKDIKLILAENPKHSAIETHTVQQECQTLS